MTKEQAKLIVENSKDRVLSKHEQELLVQALKILAGFSPLQG